ncbi:ATP-binding cassette domain-containing protein, partial [Streptococcus pneumoniae]|uniref:ATP-binding cassette domain-containing protein n=1 Tax=Streptococcus pneumoniae TaxID=1313 RepID=UPI000A87566F
MTAIVELKNATKIVKNGFDEEKIILNDVSLEIFEQDFITILGGNGAGKSTLFNTIAGTISLTSGTIRILGEDVTKFSLSLLMATLKRPELLLLDEHTAALDPKTSVALMELTDEFVKKDQLTALMITHHMEDALKYGNRLIV